MCILGKGIAIQSKQNLDGFLPRKITRISLCYDKFHDNFL